VLVAALVWLAYVAARLMFPEQIALRPGVPFLIAAVPQDAFYGIDNDVLSPICFGLVFICLIKWFLEPKPSISVGIVTGLSIAAAYLTKLSNLPLIIVAVGAILWWCILEARAGRLRGLIPLLGALAVCSAPDALDRNGMCRRCNRVPWVVIAAVRLWRLHQSVPRAALLFPGPSNVGRALIPFATLYVYGLSRLLRNQTNLVLAAIGAIAITITLLEVLANRVAFTSAYNWFHM